MNCNGQIVKLPKCQNVIMETKFYFFINIKQIFNKEIFEYGN